MATKAKKKPTNASPESDGKARTRVRQTPKHRTFKLSKKKYKQSKKLPNAWQLFKSSLKIFNNNKFLFLGIIVIYSLFSFIFVQGFGSSFNIVELRNNIEEYLGDEKDNVGVTVALFGYMLGSSGSSVGDVAGVYQMFMILLVTLAVIWGVRQIQAGNKPGIRDVFYKGIYPLVPFIGVIIVIFLQLIPLMIGNLIYATVIQNNLASSPIESVLWFSLFILLALLSVYMVISSIFSLYIVTLPDMKPIKALRSARELVLHRRVSVMIRIFSLAILMTLACVIIFLPLLFIAPQVAQILFILATSFALVFFHIYMYLLYRELI